MNIEEAAKAAGILPERDETFGKVYEVELQQLAAFAKIIRNQALEDAAKKRAGSPRKLPRVGSGALLSEQQYCYEIGYKEGVAAVRAAIRAMKEQT